MSIVQSNQSTSLPRIRLKISRQWYIEDATSKWVSYSLPGGSGNQTIKVQYPKATKRPAQTIPLTEEQSVRLAGLLVACQTRLPGEVRGRGSEDGDRIELSLSYPGVSASYTWERPAPEGWECLGRLVDFLKEMAGDGAEG